jgi:hypothetical protein
MKSKEQIAADLEQARTEKAFLVMGMVGCAEELARMILADGSSPNHEAARYVLRKGREIDDQCLRIDALADALTAPEIGHS